MLNLCMSFGGSSLTFLSEFSKNKWVDPFFLTEIIGLVCLGPRGYGPKKIKIKIEMAQCHFFY